MLQSNVAEISFSSSNFENDRLFKSLDLFAEALKFHGISISKTSKVALEALTQVSPQKKLAIADYLDNWRLWISPVLDEKGQILPYCEKVTFKKALAHYGMSISDDFWATLEPDHIIELYGPEMVQLYRSLNFFNVCGYSLLDLMTIEWYVLWDRPMKITNQLLKTAEKYSTSYIPVGEFKVGTHLHREICNTGLTEPFEPRATIVDFQFIGTTLNPDTRQIAGFACTSKARVVAHGEDVVQLDLI